MMWSGGDVLQPFAGGLEISFQLLHLPHRRLLGLTGLPGLLGIQVLAYPWQMQALRRTRGAYVTCQRQTEWDAENTAAGSQQSHVCGNKPIALVTMPRTQIHGIHRHMYRHPPHPHPA